MSTGKPGPVFFLTGTPGSGKSSVARALLQRFPFGLHISVDDLRERVVSGIAHPVPTWTEETSRQFRLARRAAAWEARLYATHGFAVTIDDVIGRDEVSKLKKEFLRGLLVHKVLLRPSLETTLQRNATRTGKDFDTSVLDSTIRHLYESTDPDEFAVAGWLVLDSGGMSLEETVEVILRHIANL
ncbi:MAG: phosphotransferase [Meiothermus sp.]